MPVPRRRRSKSKKGMNRAHKNLQGRNVIECPNPECKKPTLPHRVCPHCGQYQGREYRTQVTST